VFNFRFVPLPHQQVCMLILKAGCIAFQQNKIQFSSASIQVVINKCFHLNPEKILSQIRLVVFEETAKMYTLFPKNDVSEPKARLL